MGKFNRGEYEELLLVLDSTHDSIVNSSSKFLNLEPESVEAAAAFLFETIKNTILSSKLKEKVDNLMPHN
jgi:replicative superfamily II helicase